MSRALDDIAAERRRQIEVEGWSPEHDDEHWLGQLAAAASAYAFTAGDYATVGPRPAPGWWPWEAAWWKPKDRREDLVRAGALIVAEIERLDRQAARR